MGLNSIRLGKTGLQVSELALGTARFGKKRPAAGERIPGEPQHEFPDSNAEAGGNLTALPESSAGAGAEK